MVLQARYGVTLRKQQISRPGIAKNDNNDTNKTSNNPTMQPPNSQRTKLKQGRHGVVFDIFLSNGGGIHYIVYSSDMPDTR